MARGGSVNLAGAAVAAGSQFVLVLILTNFFDAELAGVVFAATSLILILAGLAALGTDTGLARFLLRFEELGRHGDVRTAVWVAGLPVLGISVTLAAALFFGAEALALAMGLERAESAQALRFLALVLPAIALNDFGLAGTRALGTMRTTVLVDKFMRTLMQPLLILGVAAISGGLLLVVSAWAIPYAASSLTALFLLRRMLHRRGALRMHLDRMPPRAVWREFWAFTWLRGVARFLQIVLQRADIVIIGALLGPMEAALYTAATRFVVLGQFVVQAIQNVLLPQFSKLLARRENAVVQNLLHIATAWSSTLALPIYAIAALSAPLYLGLFGSSYAKSGGAEAVVVIMSIAMAVSVIAGPLDTLLIMSGHSGASLANICVALAVDLTLCLFLIPQIGVAGAAIAWAAAIVSKNLLAYLQVQRWLGMTPQSLAGVFVVGSALIAFALPLGIIRAFDVLSWSSLAAAVAGGSTVYLLALFLLRQRLQLAALKAVVRR
ncbi:hypothetical protein AVL62_15130 [Serinicoccus chungangensis]|uniref:Uncharacterized protein n=1 Tax=Serinicoccus chungangensis TaxID=767452 RepID=A0A0W8IB10_9MICO|nr:hypothetical protein AVL62_15130 [Serinicoccus chungangensis]